MQAFRADLDPRSDDLRAKLLEDPEALARDAVHGGAELIRRLCTCTSCFCPDMHHSVVEAVLHTSWQETDLLCCAVLEFVQELVGAVPSFHQQCIQALVAAFVPTKQAGSESAEELRLNVLSHIHEALRAILRACPLASRCVTLAARSVTRPCTRSWPASRA
jgi:hypothetical protein